MVIPLLNITECINGFFKKNKQKIRLSTKIL